MVTLSTILLWGWGTFSLLLFYVIFKVWYTYKQSNNYFRKHGIPSLRMGLRQTIRVLSGATSLADFEMEIYLEASKFESPLVGLTGMFGLRSIYIMNLDLVKNICVKDFDHFVNHQQMETQQANKYIRRMLFAMEGERWKGVRAKLSPAFTSGKIRKMTDIFRQSSEHMAAFIRRQLQEDSLENWKVTLDFSQVFPKYAMDVIARCAFGIDSQCWEGRPEEKSIFEQMGKQFQFQFSLKGLPKFILMALMPKIADLLEMDVMDWESQEYFSKVIKDVIKARRQTGRKQEDFLQLMMDAQQGLLKAEEDEEIGLVMNGVEAESNDREARSSNTGGRNVIFEDEDLVANALLFLLGGFDPTQSVLLFTMYNLATEEDVQEKLYKEVMSVTRGNRGVLTYETVTEMVYLDMVINETLRLFPPTGKAERVATKDYPVPGTDFLIEKGTSVFIPIHPVHRDPRYYDHPEKFLPERFSSENKSSRHHCAFMPFGHGPRNCIGMRFALVKVKVAIAQLVQNFQFAPATNTAGGDVICGTKFHIEFDSSANLKPKGGLWLSVTPRK